MLCSNGAYVNHTHNATEQCKTEQKGVWGWIRDWSVVYAPESLLVTTEPCLNNKRSLRCFVALWVTNYYVRLWWSTVYSIGSSVCKRFYIGVEGIKSCWLWKWWRCAKLFVTIQLELKVYAKSVQQPFTAVVAEDKCVKIIVLSK